MAGTESQGRITGLEADLVLEGALDQPQLARLREAAESCRISRALNVPVALRLSRA